MIVPSFQQIWERVSFLAVLDILLVAALIFWLLGVIRGTRAVQLLRGVGILVVVALLAGSTLPLTTLRWIIREALSPALFVAIPILFQPELRRALESLGRTGEWFNRFGSTNRSEVEEMINTISRAAKQLSQQGIGALMVIERDTGLQEYADRGVIVDSRISVPLLVNIFFPNAPLHDMAVLFRRNRILAANCVLPLSENVVGSTRYGTRHRAALGISEQSDAISVIVSEETGSISITHDGRMVRHLTEGRLRKLLAGLLRVELSEEEEA
ncbi:membrane protein [Herpetosiphon geysericola]|uniref:Diadenylate cyclase n=1 Tax=Herpetosiphon geysericola TaxID=70996 RepID=A0A0P6Y0G9_9CHLR|nr:diadenylate cyclase CdaA [Herpetosiphon giganteus]KPL85937.1 membrane protein [Herpetosiphon geysericola]